MHTGAHRGHKRVFDPLELELQAAMRHLSSNVISFFPVHVRMWLKGFLGVGKHILNTCGLKPFQKSD